MEKPKIEEAPGLVWRARKDRWVATWQARSDIIRLGFMPQTVTLWDGVSPNATEAKMIASQCQRLQSEMLLFSRNGDFEVPDTVSSLRELINKYQTDPASTHHKKRWQTRRTHDAILKRIQESHGEESIANIRHKTLVIWHDEWSEQGDKAAMGHSFMGLLRSVFGFGMRILEDKECERLVPVMHGLRLEGGGQAREEAMTAEQATAHRKESRKAGLFSMALAQALQFDLMLRQKDVLGEWVPVSERGVSDVIHPTKHLKWMRGIRWESISEDLILTHVTSKKGKKIEIDLKLAPMVMEELDILIQHLGERPTKGPVVVCEPTGVPWNATYFRRRWRGIANTCKIPVNVQSRDSRAGAISEATELGAELEHVKHAATHSNIAMTEKYSRLKNKKIRNVQLIRMDGRNGTKTESHD